jgi:hypothetical protein
MILFKKKVVSLSKSSRSGMENNNSNSLNLELLKVTIEYVYIQEIKESMETQ